THLRHARHGGERLIGASSAISGIPKRAHQAIRRPFRLQPEREERYSPLYSRETSPMRRNSRNELVAELGSITARIIASRAKPGPLEWSAGAPALAARPRTQIGARSPNSMQPTGDDRWLMP